MQSLVIRGVPLQARTYGSLVMEPRICVRLLRLAVEKVPRHNELVPLKQGGLVQTKILLPGVHLVTILTLLCDAGMTPLVQSDSTWTCLVRLLWPKWVLTPQPFARLSLLTGLLPSILDSPA